jgi:hypothetical protein
MNKFTSMTDFMWLLVMLDVIEIEVHDDIFWDEEIWAWCGRSQEAYDRHCDRFTRGSL